MTSCAYCGIVFSRFKHQVHRPNPAPAPLVTQPITRSYLSLGEMKDLSAFFHHLGTQLGAGIPLNEALRSCQSPNGAIPSSKWADGIDGGMGMLEAFRQTGPRWPGFVWAHLEAGETCGQLPDLLQQLSVELASRRKWVLDQLFSLRTLYLIVVFVAAAFALSVLGAVGGLDEATARTDSHTVLMAIIGGGFKRFVIWLLVFGLLAALFFRFQMVWKHQLTQRSRRFESLRLNIPLTGQINALEALSRYTKLLGVCIESGLPIQKCLAFAQNDVSYPRWRQQFDRVRNGLDNGLDLPDAFSGIKGIDHDLIQVLRTGSKTGTLAEGLAETSVALKEKANRLRKPLTATYAAIAFAVAIIVTLMVLIKGFMAPFELYDRMF